MKTSDTIEALAAALSAAQATMRAAKKTSTNPHFRSKYADLAQCIAAARQPLADNGLAVVQGIEANEAGDVVCVTRLLHSSGQWIEAATTVPVGQKRTAQAVGSATTYARRYALCGMVGLASDDDDGQGASGSRERASEDPRPARKAREPSEDPHARLRGAWFARLKAIGEHSGIDVSEEERKAMQKRLWGVDSGSDLHPGDALHHLDLLHATDDSFLIDLLVELRTDEPDGEERP